jgi:hypothetical protein
MQSLISETSETTWKSALFFRSVVTKERFDGDHLLLCIFSHGIAL